MGTIVVTGFEPFGGDSENPSAEIARLLHRSTVAHATIVGEVLPVEYSRLDCVLDDLLSRTEPTMVLGVGLASGRATVCLERFAVNMCDAVETDNAGIALHGTAIVDGAPSAYPATIAIDTCCAAIQQAGIPCLPSVSAGAFLCNRLFFSLLHYAANRGAPARVGFVHVPYASDYVARHGRGAASLPMEMLVDAVRIVIRESFA